MMPQLRRVRASWPHDVYRCYDGAGRLLYVGISANGYGRLEAHRRGSPWWSHVRRVRVEQYRDRGAASAAEAICVRDELPIHNLRKEASALYLTPSPPLSVDDFEVA